MKRSPNRRARNGCVPSEKTPFYKQDTDITKNGTFKVQSFLYIFSIFTGDATVINKINGSRVN